MRLTNEDLQFLRQVHTYLYEANQRQLSVPLAGLIGRMEMGRDKQRESNKRRAAKNRRMVTLGTLPITRRKAST